MLTYKADLEQVFFFYAQCNPAEAMEEVLRAGPLSGLKAWALWAACHGPWSCLGT